MNEEKLNLSTRKLLKNVGINSQRIIENNIRSAVESGNIKSDKKIKVLISVKIEELNINENIEGDIEVEL